MRYVPLIELPVLVLLVLIRAAMLRRQGVKALVFGRTDKSDFLLVPVMAFFLYALLAAVFNWPFPELLKRPFWEAEIFYWTASVLCTASLVWFALTLKTFGRSFRVGIDEETNDKLITDGTFALSRNPIYVGFMAFFLGVFLAYPGIVTLVFLAFFSAAIHRQVLREEKFLKSRYGDGYEAYCKGTRRYL